MNQFHLHPPQASLNAGEVDWLYFGLTGMMIFFCAVVFLPIIFFCIRYRRGSRVNRSNPSSGNDLIETTWTLFPLVVSLGFFTWGAIVYYDIERPPRDSLEVQVVGKQWMWKLQHAEGKKEINELHVPLGKPVKLTMTSQDVIHGFFVPAFRSKAGCRARAIHDRVVHADAARRVSSLLCRVLRDRAFADGGAVVVMDPAEYQHWLTTGDVGESHCHGRSAAFREKGCSGCHEGSNVVRAPVLAGIYRQAGPLAIGRSRDSGRAIHPGFHPFAQETNLGRLPEHHAELSGHISEEELMQIIAYLKSIGDQQSETP